MDEVERLRRQQSALADFGSFAFRETDLQIVLTEAARICAQCLDVPFAKICRYRSAEKDLLIVAGYGWQNGVIGWSVSAANETSTQGRAFVTGEPVILADVAKNNSYELPAFYAQHGIVSTVDVLIKSKSGSWGVLEADSSVKHDFDNYDIVFLTGFANVLAEAVATSERMGTMQGSIAQMQILIAEKDQLLGALAGREIHLHDLQSELLHVSRLNAVGLMTAAIAHELNQPLAAIANYVGAAKLSLDSASAEAAGLDYAREMIGKAEEQTLRAGKVIRDLREMMEKRESVRKHEILESVVKAAMAIVLFGADESHIDVKLKVAAEIPPVLIDRVQIKQILFNLIRNSIEAMREAETRKLTITIEPGEPDFIDVTVRDTGSGMPDDVLERLFQPFITTKNEGMGLGLMICQTLAESNGGRIWRLNDGAIGTAFRFCVPVAIASDGLLPLAA